MGTLNGEIYNVCETSWASSYSNLTISDNPILGGNYQAGNSLHAVGKVVLPNRVNFYAIGFILLEPGFKAEIGSVFSANTSACLHDNN